jgi:hypothetical protein
MNNIEINISNVTGSLLGKLDLGDAEINTVFSLVDVREPEKKKVNHTKTFTIPGTKKNHQIFSHIQTEGFEAWMYDPNFKLDAQILVNGNQYFNGYLQLNDLVKDDSDNIVGYNITIYQKFTDFYNNINEKLVDLIDVSEYDHDYTYKNIVGSWEKFIIKSYKQASFSLGDGYVYPYDWKGQSDFRYYSINDMKPAFYVKTLIDRIFKSQGITYQSNFFNGEYFRKLIIPYSGEGSIELSKEVINRSSTRVGMIDQPADPGKPPGTANDIYLLNIDSRTNYEITTAPTFTDKNDTLNQYYDSNNNFLNNKMGVPKNGKYIFNVRLPLRVFFTGLEPDGTPIGEFKTVGGQYEVMLYLKRNGTVIDSWKETMTDSKYNTDTFAYTTDTVFVGDSYTGFFQEGDLLSLEVKLIATGSNFSYKTRKKNFIGYTTKKTLVKLCLTNISSSYVGDQRPIFSMALVDENVEEGDPLSMNFFLPDIKGGDLIKDINKMFNLYWMQLEDNKFLIEPRDNFFIGGNVKDWTDAVDEESEIKIEPLYELTANEYKFSYSEDDDYYNNDYFTDYEEVYGSKSIKIENDFIEQTLDIKTGFAASPLIRFNGTDRKGVGYVDAENNYNKPKTRILFYGGLLKSTSAWFFKSTINNYVFPGFGYYPYAGHVDNPDSPIYDLSWSVPKRLYYDWDNLVNGNLYNLFWRSQIEETTDKNGHLLTGTFILGDTDMNAFDIRDTIQFRNVYYRVNKITHNPLLGVAEVELLKLKNYTAFKTSRINSSVASGNGNIAGTTWGWGYTKYRSTRLSNGSTGITLPTLWRTPQIWNSINPTFAPTYTWYTEETVIRGFKNPTYIKNGSTNGDIVPIKSYYPTKVKSVNKNFYSRQGSIKVLGQNNYIAPTSLNVEVNGDDNKIGNNVKNLRITGNGNLIESGVENVTVIGDNQHVRKSNVSYIYGNIIDEAGLRKDVTILRGSIDGCLVSGGKNSVKANTIYSGGQDRS